MHYEITVFSLCFPLSDKQWKRLMRISDTSRKGWPEREEALFKELETCGGSGFNFNGHFGRNFFCQVFDIKDAPKLTVKLEEILGKT